MDSLLNKGRPPVFCPGCSHDRITHALDKAFQNLELPGNQIAIVSDIGCSGLFDTFFHTHAMHGLHGRALTYAAGIKLAKPALNVVVTMGDGGQGIGGAHLLAACRRNLNLTLLVLNNFNFGMTGGQFSATTPSAAQVGSGFLNRLELPLDICRVAQAAGAAYVRRCSSYQKDLADEITRAIDFDGFSLIDIWGICPGRYTRRNKITPKMIEENLKSMPPANGPVAANAREEYGSHYRKTAAGLSVSPATAKIEKLFTPPQVGRQDIIILGNAGQRIITAGEILCLAGMSAGLQATQKSEYNVTVLRGPSISELILSEQDIGFTGIDQPAVVIALSREGTDRRRSLFDHLDRQTLILQAAGVNLPPCRATVQSVDFKAQGLNTRDWALASLVVLAKQNKIISLPMLKSALKHRFKKDALIKALSLIERIAL